MPKTAADSPTTDEVSVNRARRLFFVRLGEMSAKMACAFLLPALIGIFADKKLNSGYLWAIIGIIVGVIFSIIVIVGMVRKLNKETNS